MQVGGGGHVMGNGGNTGVTAGQVEVTGFETTGELVHGRGKKRTRKMRDWEWAGVVTLTHCKGHYLLLLSCVILFYVISLMLSFFCLLK